MVRGFYTLASGMLTKNRILNTVSNNVANTNTTGFKAQHLTQKTFGEMVASRLDSASTEIGSLALGTTVDEAVTDFTQGSLNSTGRALDFAISGDGFFAVQTADGVAYTRNGSFNLDAEGYLVLNGAGRVLGRNGQPIYLGTDNITSDGAGNLYINGAAAGSIGVFRFPDNAQLTIVGEGFFQGVGATADPQPQVVWQSLENSNTEMAAELTRGMTAQRGLQSCSQALKIYDTVLDKAIDLGRV
ncbi:MAG: Flagellar basal body protein [Thermocaproicibacter melissae]|jgi:flagellar basal-body rod protein FlgF|uniref:flagellar hook-basal body protein n=1 Tax=Thermocaproicibacter melissae TaxID=2966552 RepID=UPI0024B12B6F|nr:flagellar hook-basal body protein [Thermocaproicibacter melissae]WBY64333.1 flagellar hook-basal body protein [Thermocaproicibacter melissae]